MSERTPVGTPDSPPPSWMDEQQKDFEHFERQRQEARDKVMAALLDARVLLAPDREMPRALRAEIRNLVETALRHLNDSWSNV